MRGKEGIPLKDLKKALIAGITAVSMCLTMMPMEAGVPVWGNAEAFYDYDYDWDDSVSADTTGPGETYSRETYHRDEDDTPGATTAPPETMPPMTEMSWNFNASTGTLTISGMRDFSYSNTADWYSTCNRKVKHLVIEECVASIGNYAFSFIGDPSGMTVELPESLRRIGENAFSRSRSRWMSWRRRIIRCRCSSGRICAAV